MLKKHKLEGALYGAAYGDSLGAITEFCTQKEIFSKFAKGVHDYTDSISEITAGIAPGHVTDDFGSSCYVMQTIIEHDGLFDKDIATEAVIKWSKDPETFSKYAGRNTKVAMEALENGSKINPIVSSRNYMNKNTNGGAMKISPIAILAQGSQLKAREFATDLCWPTHYNSAAVSAAVAISCAVCESLNLNASLESILDSAISGAKASWEELCLAGYETFGPHIDERIKFAHDLGLKCQSNDEVLECLRTKVGTGILVQESIPAVFTIIAGTKGNFADAIYCAVNAGGDTDTIASMCGAILGGLYGVDVIPEAALTRIKEVNEDLKLKETIEEYINLFL